MLKTCSHPRNVLLKGDFLDELRKSILVLFLWCDIAKSVKTMNENRELTKAELEIMQIIWAKGRVLVHDIL